MVDHQEVWDIFESCGLYTNFIWNLRFLLGTESQKAPERYVLSLISMTRKKLKQKCQVNTTEGYVETPTSWGVPSSSPIYMPSAVRFQSAAGEAPTCTRWLWGGGIVSLKNNSIFVPHWHRSRREVQYALVFLHNVHLGILLLVWCRIVNFSLGFAFI